MNDATQQAIKQLHTLSVRQLQHRFRELFGEPSTSSNRDHLFRRVAWRLQSRALGDLSERARQRAAELADDANLRLRAPASFWRAWEKRPGQPARDPRLPAPGTLLQRSYRHRCIEVLVLDKGFEYNGKTYSSLSAIAQHATGTRWNGFLFFGLTKRNPHE
jgi:hypothetical protein